MKISSRILWGMEKQKVWRHIGKFHTSHKFCPHKKVDFGCDITGSMARSCLSYIDVKKRKSPCSPWGGSVSCVSFSPTDRCWSLPPLSPHASSPVSYTVREKSQHDVLILKGIEGHQEERCFPCCYTSATWQWHPPILGPAPFYSRPPGLPQWPSGCGGRCCASGGHLRSAHCAAGQRWVANGLQSGNPLILKCWKCKIKSHSQSFKKTNKKQFVVIMWRKNKTRSDFYQFLMNLLHFIHFLPVLLISTKQVQRYTHGVLLETKTEWNL